jgi:nitronate monooxygenase
MWCDTVISKRLGIAYPILQGPFGNGLSSVELVAAVSKAGGLGCFGANSLSAEQIKEIAGEIRARTDKPFAINLWVGGTSEPAPSKEQIDRMRLWFVPFYRELGMRPPPLPKRFAPDYQSQIEAVIAVKPHVFSFTFGIPSSDILRECRRRGIVTIGTASTVQEARALDDGNVDAIVATGFEAGGDSGSFLHESQDRLTGTLALVPQVVDAVKVPVIAAGGIADERGLLAALALGAQGVQIGTAFLACEESAVASVHRDKFFTDDARDTVLSRALSGRLTRAIPNRLMTELAARASSPPYPVQKWFIDTLRSAAVAQGRSDLLPLAAGQAAPLARRQSAATFMAQLAEQTPRLLARLSR